jgi:hypothetical protein
LVNDKIHGSELKASYSMVKVNLPFGKLLCQEIELEQITGVLRISNDKKTIRWNVSEFGDDGQSKNKKYFDNLVRNAVYRPKIRIISKFYNDTMHQIQEWTGKVKTFLNKQTVIKK